MKDDTFTIDNICDVCSCDESAMCGKTPHQCIAGYNKNLRKQELHDFATRKDEREKCLKVIDQIRETAVEMLNPPSGYFSSQERFRKDCLEEIDMNIRTLRQQEQQK